VHRQICGIHELVVKLLNRDGFTRDFEERVRAKRAERERVWDDKWREECDGKRLFEDMRRSGIVRGDLLRLKKRVAGELKHRKTEVWSALADQFRSLVGAI
jgi:hypothetical protein